MSYYNKIKDELTELLSDFETAKSNINKLLLELKETKETDEKTKKEIIQMAKERQLGFPSLAKAYDDFFQLQDRKIIDFMKYKDKSAVRASELVSEYARQRRQAVSEKKIAEYLLDYYETICPFLLDLKEEVEDIKEEEKELLKEYSEEELEDEATKYLTKEEYRKLPSIERNQMALDRYWKRPKSNWHIGRIYERYVGYLYEEMGYNVEYVGIFKGFQDLGRDLIAKKDNEIIIIQCKNWSKFKTIYEKHIFQFFGTVFQYKDENRDKDVKAIFYTTTSLSELARRFGKELGIELKENFKMDRLYPCIKCNVAMTKEKTKIYHLPFDQMYDKVKIREELGEFYCKTIKEAEDNGFRRAFRYKGLKSK